MACLDSWLQDREVKELKKVGSHDGMVVGIGGERMGLGSRKF